MQVKKNKKQARIIAIVLALLMMATLCPQRVSYAEDILLTEDTGQTEDIAEPLTADEIEVESDAAAEAEPVLENPDEQIPEIVEEVSFPEPENECAAELIEISEQEEADLPEKTDGDPEPIELAELQKLNEEPILEVMDDIEPYPWQGKSDAEFAGWVRSESNIIYIRNLLNGSSEEIMEEKSLFEDRIESIEIDILKEDIKAYVDSMLHIGDTIEDAAEVEPESFTEDSVPEPVTTEPVPDSQEDPSGTDINTAEEPENPEEEPTEETDNIQQNETAPVQEKNVYVWDFEADADFKAWVLDKANKRYVICINSAGDDAELLREKEAFEQRIEAVVSEDDRQEIRNAVSMLSQRLLAAPKPEQITYIKGRDNAIRFIEDNLIARKTNFTLYYEYDGLLDAQDVRSLALELMREADGAYIENYNGNGNASDYLAFQASAGCGSTAIKEITDNNTRLSFVYTASYYDTAEEEAQVQSQAAGLLSSLGVYQMSSSYDKARAIYDWVTSNVRYGYCSDNPNNHPYSSYGALIEKTAVCQGISALVYKLMNDAGVPCRTMASGSHAWNIVQIDGVWYIVDATNGTLGKEQYFLQGTDMYSRYQQPMPGYSDMWNSISKMSYSTATAATSGAICTNVKWSIQDNVLTFEPKDPAKYSSLASTREEYSKWTKEVVNKHYTYIDTVVIKDIRDYGNPEPMSSEYFIDGCEFRNVRTFIHKGPVPTNAYMYTGDAAGITVNIPCGWTEDNIKAMGFYWYADPYLKEHKEMNPNGPKVVKTHDFSITEDPATCTEPGGTILVCSLCGTKQETEVSLPALGHNYVETARKDATCKEEGYVTSKCSRCNDTKTEKLHLTDHKWTETSRIEPDCEKTGKSICTCEICRETKEEVLKALGHRPEAMASTDTTTGGIQCARCRKILEEPVKGISISLSGVGKGETVYINGIPYTANANNQVVIPANARNISTAATYSYSSGNGGSYPTGMKVWILAQDSRTGLVTAERASFLDNLMTYSGTSIRLKGNQGIAIHTDISSGTWNSLVSGNYHGYAVQEAGLLVTKIFENETPTYGGTGVIKGMAYDRGGSIRSVNPDGGRCYYMNTLVFGNDMEKTKWSLACRPYMILKDFGGNAITLYGGILVRSVRSVAQQIQPMYMNDKAVSDFIKKILSA